MGIGVDRSKTRLLEHLYKDVNSPVCFTSVEPLLREAKRHNKKIKRKDVEDFLATQSAYTLHRQAKRRYVRLPTLASGLHTEWQADLSVFDRLGKSNRGYKYLLVCIDTLSRQLFVEPVRSKSSTDMITAFDLLFDRSKYLPWKLLTDQGVEFTAKRMKDYFKSKGVKHFCMFTSPQFHAGMAERANRSIKERLYRYFTERKTQTWINVIQNLVRAINHSHNSSIGMRPVDVTFNNAEKVRQQLFEKAMHSRPKRPAKFKMGERVRIEKHKHIFQKGYLPRFTNEIFTVAEVHNERSPVVYRLQDGDQEMIRGWFYASDLCRVRQMTNSDGEQQQQPLYDIERVIRRKTRDGIEYALVKWKGYGIRHNSWIPASSITWKNI